MRILLFLMLRNLKKKIIQTIFQKKKNLTNFHTTVDTGVDPHLPRNCYSEFLTITFCGITGPCANRTCPFYGYCVANQTTAECKCDIACIEIMLQYVEQMKRHIAISVIWDVKLVLIRKTLPCLTRGNAVSQMIIIIKQYFASKKTQCRIQLTILPSLWSYFGVSFLSLNNCSV